MALKEEDLDFENETDIALVFKGGEDGSWVLETVLPNPEFAFDDDPVPDHWRVAYTIRELIIREDKDFRDLVLQKMEELEEGQ